MYCFNIFSISKSSQSDVDASVKNVTGFAAVLDRKPLKIWLFLTEQCKSAVYSHVKITDDSIKNHHRLAEKIKNTKNIILQNLTCKNGTV